MRRLSKLGMAVVAVTVGLSCFLFGSGAGSYLQSLITASRGKARGAVPLDFEIHRARDLTAGILSDTGRLLEAYSRQELAAEDLERNIRRSKALQAKLRQGLVAMQSRLENTTTRLVSTGEEDIGRTEAEAQLASLFRQYLTGKSTLEFQQGALRAKHKALTGMKTRLLELASEKTRLESEIDRLEATLQCVRAADVQPAEEVDGAVAQAAKVIDEVDQRVRLLSRMAANREKLPLPSKSPKDRWGPEHGQSVLSAVSEYFASEESSAASQ